VAIHSIPTDLLPEDDEQLLTFLKSSIDNGKPVTIGSARYLNKDRDARAKQATSVVASVNADDLAALLPVLFLFSKWLKVEKTTQVNRYTQCLNSYHFGHTHARCTQKHPTCPYCPLHHTRTPQSCQNPTCPKGGETKPISGCCPSSPPQCPNCGDDHNAFSRECKARPVPPPQPQVPGPCDEELSDAASDSEEAMDLGDAGHPTPATSGIPSTQTIDLSTPRPPQQTRDAPAPPCGSQPALTDRGLRPVTPSKTSGSCHKR